MRRCWCRWWRTNRRNRAADARTSTCAITRADQFPGGRAEEIDADAEYNRRARQAEEEVGPAPAHVDEVIGMLPVHTTVTGFHVTPVVALVRPGFTLAIDSFEVAEAFELPLPFLMDPA